MVDSSTKPRILVIDIETRPAELYGWGMFKQSFGVEQVKTPPSILCVGWKWVGEREIHVETEWELGSETMLRRVHSLLESADAVVGKNSARFDIPWLMTEFLKYNIPHPGPITQIDLEKTARYSFRFLSNRLDFITNYLGIGQKVQHEGFPLWRKVMEGNEAARKKMVRYCAGDIRITERLYKRMRGFILDHPYMGNTPSDNCAACGSPNVEGRGWRRTRSYLIQKVHCNACGSWRSGKRMKVA